MKHLNQNGGAMKPLQEAASKETAPEINQGCMSYFFKCLFLMIGAFSGVIIGSFVFFLYWGVLFMTSIIALLWLKFDKQKTPLRERPHTPRKELLEIVAQAGAEVSGMFILFICLWLIYKHWSTLWPLISKYL